MCAAIRRSARMLRHYAGCIALFLMCIGLTSCSRKKTREASCVRGKPIVAVDEIVMTATCESDNSSSYEDDVDIPDVPRPLQGVYLIASSWQTFSNDRLNIMAQYESAATMSQLTDFYRQQMEFLGWELDADFKGRDDACFVYRRPTRCCVITMRVSDNVTHVAIMYQSEFNNSII